MTATSTPAAPSPATSAPVWTSSTTGCPTKVTRQQIFLSYLKYFCDVCRNIRGRVRAEPRPPAAAQRVLQPVLGLGRRGRRHVQADQGIQPDYYTIQNGYSQVKIDTLHIYEQNSISCI